VTSWKDFMALGRDDSLDDKLDISLSKIAANKCGVMLSHDNITFTARIIGETYKLKEKEERFVSYLPLSHIAAAIVDLFIAITFRATKIQEKMMETAKSTKGFKRIVGKWAKDTGYRYNKSLIEQPTQHGVDIQYKTSGSTRVSKGESLRERYEHDYPGVLLESGHIDHGDIWN
ncbi:Uncharacterized protein FKW44_020947, partial [Caligus rogercresseyi]